MSDPKLKIVLVHPEIPQNTGSIGRTCVALDLELILIKPYGFSITEKTVSRAGTRYWQFIELSEYDCWDDFITDRKPPRDEMYLFEENGSQSFYEPSYSPNGYLVFGKESTGIPMNIRDEYHERMYHLPMRSDRVKSLNLANAATATIYQAMRGTFMGG